MLAHASSVIVANLPMLLRLATPQDLPGIAAIYDREVLEGIATFMTVPYTPREWQDWLAAHQRPRYPAVVAVDDADHDRVAAWASLSPWSPRQAYDRSAESSVYVAPAYQACGLGRLVMLDALARAKSAGVCVAIARVVEQNPASVRFHERLGYQTIGLMRRVGEKFGRLLDVRVMDLHLDLASMP